MQAACVAVLLFFLQLSRATMVGPAATEGVRWSGVRSSCRVFFRNSVKQEVHQHMLWHTSFHSETQG